MKAYPSRTEEDVQRCVEMYLANKWLCYLQNLKTIVDNLPHGHVLLLSPGDEKSDIWPCMVVVENLELSKIREIRRIEGFKQILESIPPEELSGFK